MKNQALICLIAIQAFICTGTLLGVEPVIAGAINDVAVGHAKTAVYVVDQAADTNPGTEQMPFKTVQSAADAAKPSDTIYVMAGRYDKLFKVKAGGTESKPVAFVAMPRREIKIVHVDCFQTFTNNGEIAIDLPFEYNTCFDFHQMYMIESAPHVDSVRGWTFRYNIVSTNSPMMRGGWGPDIMQTPDATIENCTISAVNWAAIGLRGAESTGGLIRNNILCEAQRVIVDGDRDFSASNPVIEYNLTFKIAPNINGKNPLFVDPQKRDFRLRPGSSAIGTVEGSMTVRAMKGEKVTISGADMIEGWKHEVDGSWSASLVAEPKKLLRDGRPWSEFSYDKAAGRIMVKTGGDPRLHVFETVLRDQGINLIDKKNIRIEEITVVNTLKKSAVAKF
jgi:hypothetical protein